MRTYGRPGQIRFLNFSDFPCCIKQKMGIGHMLVNFLLQSRVVEMCEVCTLKAFDHRDPFEYFCCYSYYDFDEVNLLRITFDQKLGILSLIHI